MAPVSQLAAQLIVTLGFLPLFPVVFTTGNGAITNFPFVPTVKVCGACFWLMDIESLYTEPQKGMDWLAGFLFLTLPL